VTVTFTSDRLLPGKTLNTRRAPLPLMVMPLLPPWMVRLSVFGPRGAVPIPVTRSVGPKANGLLVSLLVRVMVAPARSERKRWR
jgi:hypothetical protein